LLFVRRSARKAWWRSGGLSSPPASTSSHSNRAARAFSGLRCVIPTRCARRMNISRTFLMKKSQRTCWNASHIVETKSGHFNPEEFEDHYEDALKELLKKKQAGEKIEAPKERAPAKVINLMDALRRSVETERGWSPKRQAPSVKAPGSESERPKKKKSR